MALDNNGHSLRELHTQLLRSHDAYRDRVGGIADHDTLALVDRLRAMRTEHISELDRLMLTKGLEPGEDGSWALDDGEDTRNASILARNRDDMRDAALQCERMIVGLYTDSMDAVRHDRDAEAALMRQKSEIRAMIEAET